MDIKEIMLDDISIFNIKTKIANILIHSDDVEIPLIRLTGEFDVETIGEELTIEEKGLNNNSIFNFGKINISKNIVINGNIGSITNIRTSENLCEILLPKNFKKIDLNIEMMSGDMTVKNLKLGNSIIETMSGDIKLVGINGVSTQLKSMSGDISLINSIALSADMNSMSGDINLVDVDILSSEINTISGDVNVDIVNSINNYKTKFNTTVGDIICYSIEKKSDDSTMNTNMNINMCDMKIKTVNGDITVLFKGKRKESF